MNKNLLLSVLLMLASTVFTKAEDVNILFIGNSFTMRHDLPSLVKQVFEEGQPGLTVNYEMVTYGGQDLFKHYELYFSQSRLQLNSITVPDIEEMIAQIKSFQKLAEAPAFFSEYYDESGLRRTEWDNANVISGLSRSLSNQEELVQRVKNNQRLKWDYVILQSWRDVVDDVEKGYAKYAQKFAKIAKDEGVKVILYVTAPDAQNAIAVDGPFGLDQSEMEMRTIHKLVDLIHPYAVVPVAEGLKMIQENGTNLTFRYVNDMHPNQYTAFLTANMFYSAVFNKSTEGFNFNTVTETKLDANGKDPDGDDPKVVFEGAVKLLLQRTAYNAVREFNSDPSKHKLDLY